MRGYRLVSFLLLRFTDFELLALMGADVSADGYKLHPPMWGSCCMVEMRVNKQVGAFLTTYIPTYFPAWRGEIDSPLTKIPRRSGVCGWIVVAVAVAA